MKTTEEILKEIKEHHDAAYDLSMTLAAKAPQEPKEPLLWYPGAIVNCNGVKYKERGSYPNSQPQGAVLHFSASRGGNASTVAETEKYTKRVISYLAKKGYGTMSIDSFGQVYQNMPLSKWAPHAGTSSWGKYKRTNNVFLGIDIISAGKLKKENGKLLTWFNKEVDPKHAIYVPKVIDNIAAGWYEKATEAQFESLTKLLLWLESNFPDFSFDNVAGHDEVAPRRKTDLGATLVLNNEPLSGPMYRRLLKAEKSNQGMIGAM